MNVDVKKLLATSNVRVKTIAENCETESIFCKPCFVYGAGAVKEIPAIDIFQSNASNYYASFAKVDNAIALDLWNDMGFPFPVQVLEEVSRNRVVVLMIIIRK